MKNAVLTLSLWTLACLPASAGIVIEMEVKNADSGGEAATNSIYANGEMLRMQVDADRGEDGMFMIFRDERLWIVQHEKNECQTIDKKGIEEVGSQVGSQIGAAMKQMEAELSKLPPEQRAMFEKMMKGRMPGGMAPMEKEAPPRRVETGPTEQIGDYSCVVHTVYEGAEKTREICATSEAPSKLFSEAMLAFKGMSRFTKGLQQSARQMPFLTMDETPFQDVEEIGGFPIRVRTFGGGRMTSESTLKSITQRNLDDAFFSPPEDCKVKDLAEEMKRSR